MRLAAVIAPTAVALFSLFAMRTAGAVGPLRLSLEGASMTAVAPEANAREILQRAIQAKGGIDRLRAVRTIVATGTMVVRSPRPIEARTTSYVEYPDHFRQDAALPNGEVAQVVAGDKVWMRDPSGVHDLAGAAADSLRTAASRDVVSLLLHASDGALQVRLLQADANAPVDALQLSGRGAAPVELLVDRSTGMIAGERYVVEQPGAIGKVPTEEWYSDYRAVDGVQVAFKTTVRRGAAVIMERTLTDLKINAPLDKGLFQRPL